MEDEWVGGWLVGMQTMARSFYLATQLSVPPYLEHPPNLAAWMTVWLQLLELPLPAVSLGSIHLFMLPPICTDDTRGCEQEMHPKEMQYLYRNPLWRAKKWTCQTLNRLFSWYVSVTHNRLAVLTGLIMYSFGRPKAVSAEGRKFARLFFDRYAKVPPPPPLLTVTALACIAACSHVWQHI